MLELNTCQFLGRLLGYHYINDAPQFRHWKRTTSGLYFLFFYTYHCKISIKVVASASYGNRTHVNSLEGYYATNTPTMLVYSVPDGRKHYGLKRFLSEVYWKVSDPVSSSVSYGTLTFLKTLEGNYATTTPTVLVYSNLDGRNLYGFKSSWRKVFLKISNQTWSSASCWNWTHVNCLEMCCATTTSMMLLNSDTGKGGHQGCIFFCNK